MAKELANIADGLSDDQLIDLRISVLQKLDATIAEKLERAKGKGGTVAPNAVLARLPLDDAIVAFLRAAKEPKKVSQMCSTLIEAKFPFASEDPATAVKTSVRRLAASNLDIVYVGSGKWTLESLHTPAKLKKLKDKNAGRGGNSTEEHARRTRDGMIKKGLKFGRKPKFGPDDIAKFRHLVDNKIKRPMAALKEVGISTPYYYDYRDAIYAWKPGDPWPPLHGMTPNEMRASGIIPLHAKVIGEDK